MNSKKLHLFLTLVCTLTSTPIMPVLWQALQEEAPSPELSLELSMAKNMCLSQNERLYNDLLHIIDFTDEHLLYWQETQHNPYSYFFSKGPFKWLWGKKQEKEIQDHITILQRCQSWAAHHLGQVAHLSDKLTKASNDDEIKPLIFQTISFIKNYLAPTKAQLSLEQTITIQELTDLLQKNIQHLHDAKQHMWAMLEHHKRPGHFTRNWLYYFAAFIAAATAGNYLYKNPEKPAEWYTMGHNAIKKFFEDHIKQPFCDIRDLMFSKPQGEDLQATESFTSQEEIDVKQKNLDEYSTEYLKQKDQTVTEEKMSVEVQKINNGESSEIINEWDKAIEKPFSPTNRNWDILPNLQALFKLANLKFKSFEVRSLKRAYHFERAASGFQEELNKLWQASRLNFALFMTLPAVILLYGTYRTTKKVAFWFVPKYTFHTPVKNLLRSIGQLLNRYNNQTVHMGPEQEGYILYWTYKLNQYVAYMPHSAQKYFAEDIQELASPDLQIHQKLEIWNRMYKTYDFLTPYQGNQGPH